MFEPLNVYFTSNWGTLLNLVNDFLANLSTSVRSILAIECIFSIIFVLAREKIKF